MCVLTVNAYFLEVRCWPYFQPQTTMRLAATGEPTWSWDRTSSPILFSTKQTRWPILSPWPKGKAFRLLCIHQVKIPKGKTLGALRKFGSGAELSQLDLLIALEEDSSFVQKLLREAQGLSRERYKIRRGLFYRLLIFQLLFSMSSFNLWPLPRFPSALLLHKLMQGFTASAAGNCAPGMQCLVTNTEMQL